MVSCVQSHEVSNASPPTGGDVVDSDPEASARHAAGAAARKGKGSGKSAATGAAEGKGKGKGPIKRRRKVQTLTHNTPKAA